MMGSPSRLTRGWTGSDALRVGRAPEARLGIWLLLTAAASLVFYQTSVRDLTAVLLSPLAVVSEGLVHRWGVLALCVAWLWLKRRAIRADVDRGPQWLYAGLGVAYLAVSPMVFTPGALLLGGLGLFAILFGRAVTIPSLLFGLYSFAVLFPQVAEGSLAPVLTAWAAGPTAGLLAALGYPVLRSGEELRLGTATGEVIRVAVTAACAGPATIGLFVTAYGLMLIDTRLPWRMALPLFLVGMAGTWIQALARIVVLLLVGYYLGERALWQVHEWLGYVLFSLWYALFAYLYFRQARSLAAAGVAPVGR